MQPSFLFPRPAGIRSAAVLCRRLQRTAAAAQKAAFPAAFCYWCAGFSLAILPGGTALQLTQACFPVFWRGLVLGCFFHFTSLVLAALACLIRARTDAPPPGPPCL
ncbi:MAG: hypothetical protein PHD32_12010 [Eubacteriales bacterium]|nr:hypothetical protein [Eubacteriales bacterium]